VKYGANIPKGQDIFESVDSDTPGHCYLYSLPQPPEYTSSGHYADTPGHCIIGILRYLRMFKYHYFETGLTLEVRFLGFENVSDLTQHNSVITEALVVDEVIATIDKDMLDAVDLIASAMSYAVGTPDKYAEQWKAEKDEERLDTLL
jgi:hypothetical protein